MNHELHRMPDTASVRPQFPPGGPSRSAVLRGFVALTAAVAWLVAGSVSAQQSERRITLAMNAAPLADVMNMIARQERVNILLSEDVDVKVSFNVYDLTIDDAITAIATAAGYAVERRGGKYFIVERDDAGHYATSDLTQVRTYKVHYGKPVEIQNMLMPYLSRAGKISALADRMLITIEDAPDFLQRFDRLVREIDQRPQQILIEAKILEVTLSAEDSYGIDWSDLFSHRDSTGTYGTRGLLEAGSSGTTGFFLTLGNDQLQLLFNALETRGRVRTLSTPKLLALENREASVIIGDRRGYQVTTTINQVTSETIQFLESGVILRVTPQIAPDGTVMLEVHPEVSTGNVDANGIPSQVTTAVTTQLIVPSGRTVFIGGLIKHSGTLAQAGVPLLRRVPGLRRLFSNEARTETNSETIVLMTPYVVNDFGAAWTAEPLERIDSTKAEAEGDAKTLESDVTRFERRPPRGGSKHE
jgi:type II secretory pathway component GspD/PulD (secretin)